MKKSLIIFCLVLSTFSATNYVLAQKAKPIRPKTIIEAAPKPPQADVQQNFFGEIENNSYKNKFFGLKMIIPENWLIQESEVGKAVKKVGQDAIKGKTAQVQKSFDEAMQRVTILFTASKDILGIENNAIMVFAAEKKTPLMQIRNGEDYLRLTIQSFKKLQLPPDYKYSEKIESEKFGNETFHYIDIERINYRQRIYSTYRNGYALFFTWSYVTDEDLETMKNIFQNSDFAWKD